MSDKNKAIEKCKKLIALAEGTHSVNEAETALNIMKQIASKNNLRINPKTLERIGSHINALRGEKVAAPKTERPQPKTARTRRTGPRGESMAQYIRNHILNGYTNQLIIDMVEGRFGVRKDNKYINWYRSQLRRQGRG